MGTRQRLRSGTGVLVVDTAGQIGEYCCFRAGVASKGPGETQPCMVECFPCNTHPDSLMNYLLQSHVNDSGPDMSN